MKNIIKTIKIFALVAVFLGGAFTAFAADTTLNQHPSDLPTFRVRNHTDLGPCTTSCAWDSSTNADAGEIVSVIIYYHNSGDAIAQDVTLKIGGTSGGSTGSATTHVLSGTVDADNASPATGSATVYLSSSQTLTYIDNSLIYYPDQGTTAYSLPDTNLFSSGVDIGDLGIGWYNQGTAVAKFQVSNVTTPTVYACNDGIDNDGDGLTDYPADLGCYSSSDTDEYNYVGGTGSAPVVDTLSATDVDEDSATLRGSLISTGGYTSTVYFKISDNGCSSFDATTSSSSLSYPASFSINFSGLESDTEYCYRAYASNAYGLDEGPKIYFTTDDDGNDGNFDVTTDSATNIDDDRATLRGEVEAGDYDVDDCWFEWGLDDHVSDLDETENVNCSVNDGDTEDFDEVITGLDADEKYYFRFCAEDNDGEEECGSIRSFTTDDNGTNFSPSGRANIITTIATEVTGSSAKLNGLMTESGDSYTYGYFEWGTSTALSSRTADISLGDTNNDIAFGNFVINLSPNTLYYFRACGRNEGGVDCGDILSFRTLSGGSFTYTVPTTITTVTNISSGTGGDARIMLEITSPYENACPTDINDYTVTYKNISGRDLEDVVLRVTLPTGVDFRRSSKGEFTASDNTLTLEIGTLERNEEGEVSISADVNYKAVSAGEDILVTTAVMAYTYESTLGQEDAIAYYIHDVNNCRDGNALGAFALFGGAGFFPSTLLGWLLLILVIMALIYVGRRLSEDARARRGATVAQRSSTRSVDDLPY